MNTTLLCLFLQISTLFFASSTRDFAQRISAEKSRIETVVDFSGEGAYEVFPGSKWQFFGPVRTITVADGQKIVASGTAVLGTKSGMTRAAIALCYQGATVGTSPFVGDSHLNVDIDTLQRNYSVNGTVTLPPGRYSVGYCLVNTGREVIGNNNYVNGWAMTVSGEP